MALNTDISDNDINNDIDNIMSLIMRELVHVCRPRLPLTQQSQRMLQLFSSWLLPLSKKVMYGPPGDLLQTQPLLIPD